MRILISGGSGLIGAASIPPFVARGFSVTSLVRGGKHEIGQISWDPSQPVPPDLISGFDAVVHLAGEPIAGRWTDAKKNRIRQSRVLGTMHLCTALAKAAQPPRVLISASAIGYYGNRGDEVLREDSPPGSGFLPEVSRQWEHATSAATAAGIRTAQIRIGIVLSAAGGALKEMMPPFRFGLGAQIGNGRQWMSWIHIDDLVGSIHHILDNKAISGPVNLVAPGPVRNSEFTRTLAKELSRPAVLRIPDFAVRLVFGEMGNDLLLASQRVEPANLSASGYHFKFCDLKTALENILSRHAAS